MCPWLHNVFQNLDRVLHIDQAKQIIRCMCNGLIPSHSVQWVNQYKIILFILILSDAKLVLFENISEIRIVKRAQWSHAFDEFAHCNPSLLLRVKDVARSLSYKTSSSLII